MTALLAISGWPWWWTLVVIPLVWWGAWWLVSRIVFPSRKMAEGLKVPTQGLGAPALGDQPDLGGPV